MSRTALSTSITGKGLCAERANDSFTGSATRAVPWIERRVRADLDVCGWTDVQGGELSFTQILSVHPLAEKRTFAANQTSFGSRLPVDASETDMAHA